MISSMYILSVMVTMEGWIIVFLLGGVVIYIFMLLKFYPLRIRYENNNTEFESCYTIFITSLITFIMTINMLYIMCITNNSCQIKLLNKTNL